MNKHVEEQLKKELRAAEVRVAELERDLEKERSKGVQHVSCGNWGCWYESN